MSGLGSEVLAEWTHPVEWGKVREFARAVHDPRLGREPPVPPLTFPAVLTAQFVERFVSELLPLDRRRTVHGEQEYEYLRPLQIGQQVRCTARVTRDDVKQGRRGGRMRLVTVEVELADAQSGEVIGFERMTAIEQEANGS
jgi:acyl dehydratase